MTPSRVILVVVVVALSAIAIGRQLQQFHAETDDPAGVQPTRPAWGWIGCRYTDVDEALARDVGMSLPAGVVITEVIPGSPADAAGLAPHDILRRMDDTEIDTIGDFRSVIRTTEPGQVMQFTVLRGGRPVVLMVTLGSRPIAPPPPPMELPN